MKLTNHLCNSLSLSLGKLQENLKYWPLLFRIFIELKTITKFKYPHRVLSEFSGSYSVSLAFSRPGSKKSNETLSECLVSLLLFCLIKMLNKSGYPLRFS